MAMVTADILRRANALHHAGQLLAAGALYEEVLRTEPRNFDALHLLGVVAAQTDDAHRALELLERALLLEPRNAAAHCNRANALRALGRLREALSGYVRAIALQPDYAIAHCNRGAVLKELGRYKNALTSLDRAIAIKPDYAQAYVVRGTVLAELGDIQQALASFDRASELDGNHAEAHLHRGNLLKALGQFDAASASYERAVLIRPSYHEAHLARAALFTHLQDWSAALAAYDRAIELKPDDPTGHFNRGNALRSAQRFPEALESFDRAITLKSDFASAHCNRGFVLKELHQHEAALASYDRAIAIDGFTEARFNRAALLLATGDFKRGWREYEWRCKLGKSARSARYPPKLAWRGQQPVAGKVLLLHCEQGLGDTLQFCRYAARVRDLGARVVLQVQRPLVSLLSSLDGPAHVIGTDESAPAFDYHCPLMSLPFALESADSSIPSSPPYLSADESKAAAWRALTGTLARPRVGLAWSGKSSHTNDSNRSIPLEVLAPYLPRGWQYVSLQTEPRAADVMALQSSPWLSDFTGELRDFSDTAALCSCLDLIVSVDTSVAHLSAALGYPTWILLPFNPDWRWLLREAGSAWYPSVRLYRQDQGRDWHEVLGRLRDDLQVTLQRYG